MANNVTLSSSVRTNLLSLQNTAGLIKKTQGRLSTGLAVAGPIDDPVAFFQAKSLNDRASDFTQKKKGIDQGVSTVTAATDAINGVESMVQQLKGLALNVKSATTTTEVSNIVTQFNDLRNQIGYLTSDASYQGLNLVNGTGSQLKVDFSNDTGSILKVNSVDVTVGASGLAVRQLLNSSSVNINLNFASNTAQTMTTSSTIAVTVGGSSSQTWSSGTFTFGYGGTTLTLTVGTTASGGLYNSANASGTSQTYTVGQTLTLSVASTTSGGSITTGSGGTTTLTEGTGQSIAAVGGTVGMNSLIVDLDSALTTLRSRAQTLGSNVALLQTRMDFTQNYVNTLTAGAGKLNLADLNEEGANLLALQTRQQLGIQALSFAGQAEQGILSLFR